MDPELKKVVARARKHLAEKGEWPRKEPPPLFKSNIPAEAVEILLAWSRDGGYDEAIAQLSAEDPDLANQ